MTESLLDISSLLPHRFPMLLVDAITHVEPGRHARGIKRVTGGEWAGASPGGLGTAGTLPHLLVLEALAQLSAAVLAGLVEEGSGAVGYFLGFNRVRFRGTARPGDEVRLEVTLLQFRRGICRTAAIARVDDVVIVRAELTTVIRVPPR